MNRKPPQGTVFGGGFLFKGGFLVAQSAVVAQGFPIQGGFPIFSDLPWFHATLGDKDKVSPVPHDRRAPREVRRAMGLSTAHHNFRVYRLRARDGT